MIIFFPLSIFLILTFNAFGFEVHGDSLGYEATTPSISYEKELIRKFPCLAKKVSLKFDKGMKLMDVLAIIQAQVEDKLPIQMDDSAENLVLTIPTEFSLMEVITAIKWVAANSNSSTIIRQDRLIVSP